MGYKYNKKIIKFFFSDFPNEILDYSSVRDITLLFSFYTVITIIKINILWYYILCI